MSSEFPRSPRVLKGGIVAYQLPELLPTIIVFQYNPDEVKRTLQSQGARQEIAEHVARLRALRLAKEAADKKAGEKGPSQE